MRDSDIDDDRRRTRSRGSSEDDDRPRNRPRWREFAASKRTAPALILGFSTAGFVLLLGTGIGIYLLVRDTSKPAASDLIVHAPTDAIVLSGYDFDALSRNDAFRKAMERRAPPDIVELDRAGLRAADLSRVLIARTVNNGNTCAVRFKAAPDKSKFLLAIEPGKDYGAFTSLTGNYKFGYFADDQTLVLADKEPAIRALREQGQGRLNGDLQSMVNQVRGPVWRASGRMSSSDHGRLGAGDDGFSLRVGPSAGTAAWLVPDGPVAEVRFELEFEKAAQARQAVSNLKSAFLVQRSTNELGQMINIRDGTDSGDISDIRRGYEEASVQDHGNRVSAKLQLPASEAMRAVGSVRY